MSPRRMHRRTLVCLTGGAALGVLVPRPLLGAGLGREEEHRLALGAGGPSCADLADAGVAIGSEEVVGLAYDAGGRAPGGGGPAGDAGPKGPATFCCLVG